MVRKVRKIFTRQVRRPTLVAAMCLGLLLGTASGALPDLAWMRWLSLCAAGTSLARRQTVWLLLVLTLAAGGLGNLRGAAYARKEQIYDNLMMQ